MEERTLDSSSESMGETKMFEEQEFRAITSKAIDRAKRFDRNMGFIIVHCKGIESTTGLEQKIKMHEHVYQSFLRALRSSDVVGQISASKFYILLDEIHAEENVNLVGERLLEILGACIEYEDELLSLRSDLGLGVFPESGQSFEEIEKNIQQAMDRSNHEEGNQLYRVDIPKN